MKVTLRKFLEIVDGTLIEPFTANLYVDEWDELFEEWEPRLKLEAIRNVSELEPYMDYEIYNFHQTFRYGKLCSQDIYVRKIEN